MAHNGGGVKDLRLLHVGMPDWQRGAKQALLGPTYNIVEPNTKIEPEPSQVDFDIPREDPLLFGVMSRFHIKGTFQMLAHGTTDWVNVPELEAAKVLLAPLWFEMLIKETTVFHDNNKISSSSELRHISPFLNAYLLQNMDPLAKTLLCPQRAHPGYCLPSGSEAKWTLDSAKWKTYSESAFCGQSITFDYTPLFLFPFFQGANYMLDDDVPRILPVPAMGRLQIRFAFTDSQDHIFRKKEPVANKTKYRFSFSEFSLVLEEARLTQAFDKQLMGSKKPMAFPGVTRMQLVEPVPDGSTTYRTRFQGIFMPEALFIFSLNKTVASGTYKFSTGTETTVFAAHNIKSIEMAFDGKRFSIREPHIGKFLEDKMDSKSLFDKLAEPPFGIKQDRTYLTHALTKEAGVNTAYPHIYLSLVTGPNRQRLIPALDDGSCVHKKADLELDIKFTEANSPSNRIYVIYAIWTDVNLIYDPKTKTFSSPYLQYMN